MNLNIEKSRISLTFLKLNENFKTIKMAQGEIHIIRNMPDVSIPKSTLEFISLSLIKFNMKAEYTDLEDKTQIKLVFLPMKQPNDYAYMADKLSVILQTISGIVSPTSDMAGKLIFDADGLYDPNKPIYVIKIFAGKITSHVIDQDQSTKVVDGK